jgi:hypothetical protein
MALLRVTLVTDTPRKCPSACGGEFLLVMSIPPSQGSDSFDTSNDVHIEGKAWSAEDVLSPLLQK